MWHAILIDINSKITMRQFYPISHCKVNRWFNLVLQVIFFSFSETSWICYWIFNELKYIAYHLCLRFFIFQMTKWMAFLLFFQLKNLSAEIAHWRTKQTKIVKFPRWNGYKAFSLLCTHPSSSTLLRVPLRTPSSGNTSETTRLDLLEGSFWL